MLMLHKFLDGLISYISTWIFRNYILLGIEEDPETLIDELYCQIICDPCNKFRNISKLIGISNIQLIRCYYLVKTGSENNLNNFQNLDPEPMTTPSMIAIEGW